MIQDRIEEIKEDILVDGKVAFSSGEQVFVEKISPNSIRPEYKYVVTSTLLNQKFQLREEDFVPQQQLSGYRPLERSPLPEEQVEEAAPLKSTGCGSAVWAIFVFASLVTFLVLGGVWWGWIGLVIGLAAWIVLVGGAFSAKNQSNIQTYFGDESRKQLRKKNR